MPAELPPFHGWETPRFTPIPDQLFDEWLPHLSEAELKVLLYIMRRTFGFKKSADAISLRQMSEGIVRRDGTRLDHGAGVTMRSVQRAVPGLLAKGLIEAHRQVAPDGGDAATVYRLRLSQHSRPLGQNNRPGGDNLAPAGRTQSPTQETPVQDTEIQEGVSAWTPPPGVPSAAEVQARFLAGAYRTQGPE